MCVILYGFLQHSARFSVEFELDKCHGDMHKLKEIRRKEKKTTMADQYIQIFVVWLLLSCSGLYLIDTIKENGITLQKVLF